jgi:hypothetical protein
VAGEVISHLLTSESLHNSQEQAFGPVPQRLTVGLRQGWLETGVFYENPLLEHRRLGKKPGFFGLDA